jgi:hypothetical protein
VSSAGETREKAGTSRLGIPSIAAKARVWVPIQSGALKPLAPSGVVEKCVRLRVARLIAQHGVDMRLPELRHMLANDCPRITAASTCEWCGVCYPQLALRL